MSSEKSTAVAAELSGMMMVAGTGPTGRNELPLRSREEFPSTSKNVLPIVVPMPLLVLIATKLLLPKAIEIIRRTPLAGEPVESNNALS